MRAFDCGDVETRIHEILDQRGALAGDQELVEHCAQCPNCRHQYHEYLGLAKLLRQSKSPAVATDQTYLRTGNHGRNCGTHLERPRRWAAIAAGLLVGLFVGLLFADRWMASRPAVAWRWQPASHRSANSDPLDQQREWAILPHLIPGSRTAASSPAIADQAQQWIDTIEGIPATLGDLQPYCLCTASLTGVTTLTAPVSWTVDIIRRRWASPSKPISPIRSDRSEWMSRHFRQV